MSERMFRFKIYPPDQELYTETGLIPESELRRRVTYIVLPEISMDQAIDILLHGEGKEPEPCCICKMVGVHLVWCSRGRESEQWTPKEVADRIRKTGETMVLESSHGAEPEKPWPDPADIIKMRGKESSTPTRKEWEEVKTICAEVIRFLHPVLNPNDETHDEWVEKMPIQILPETLYQWQNRLKQWHREEPPR